MRTRTSEHDDSDGDKHDRDGIPDVLQQRHVGYGPPVQYGAPVQLEQQVNYGAGFNMTETGVCI